LQGSEVWITGANLAAAKEMALAVS